MTAVEVKSSSSLALSSSALIVGLAHAEYARANFLAPTFD
jgi:hypothetical protein